MFCKLTSPSVCITSILRCVSLYPGTSGNDIPLAALKAANWSVAEVNTGIIWACMPMMKPVLYKYFPHFFKDAFPDLRPPAETPIPLYNLLLEDRGLPAADLRSHEGSFRVHTTHTAIASLPRPGQPLDLPEDLILVETVVSRVLTPHPNAGRMSRGSPSGEAMLTLEEWLGESRGTQEGLKRWEGR